MLALSIQIASVRSPPPFFTLKNTFAEKRAAVKAAADAEAEERRKAAAAKAAAERAAREAREATVKARISAKPAPARKPTRSRLADQILEQRSALEAELSKFVPGCAIVARPL